jgi:hypothetical protein
MAAQSYTAIAQNLKDIAQVVVTCTQAPKRKWILLRLLFV